MKKINFLSLGAALVLASGLMFTGCPDPNVGGGESATMNLVIKLDSTITDAAKVSVKYGDSNDEKNVTTVSADVSDNQATIEVSEDYCASGYAKVYALTVTDSSDSMIPVTFSSNSNEEKGAWFEFAEDSTVTITYTKLTTANMTLTFNFDDDAVSKVSLLYYPSGSESSAGTTLTETVSGKSVSFTVSNEYASSDGWFNATLAAYDSSDADVTSYITAMTSTNTTFGGDTSKLYWQFTADSTATVTVTYSTETQVALATDKEVTVETDSAYTQVLEASSFTDLSIGTLIVTISSETSGAWASVSGADSWATGTYQDKAINTTVYITTATFINAVKTNGLYINSSAGTFTVTVKYIEGEPKAETTYTYTQIGSDVSYTATGSLVSIVESSSFSSIETIDAIKIEVTSISFSGTDSQWFTPGYDSTWLSDNALTADSDISGYSGVITDSSTISSIKTSGLLLGANSGLTATVKVYYGVEASE